MQNYPNLLLIAGTGRNSGKTTVACQIIEKFSPDLELTAVKISPHFHLASCGLAELIKTEFYSISSEKVRYTRKDSSRMLRAGAAHVYYVEVKDTSMLDAFNALIKLIDPETPVIIESPALRKVINPGVFVLVDSDHTLNKKEDVLKLKQKADLFLDTSITNIETFINNLSFENNSWKLKV